MIFSLNCKANIIAFWDLKLDTHAGYCDNPIKEKEMWTGVNKFAKSIKDTLPGIPPAQVIYIETEKSSSNTNRRINIKSYPFYLINETLVMADNIEQLSEIYLKNQNLLTFPKKVEITARTLLNVTSPPFDSDYSDALTRKLAENDYKIDVRHLRRFSLSLWSIETMLLNHLICFGENSTRN